MSRSLLRAAATAVVVVGSSAALAAPAVAVPIPQTTAPGTLPAIVGAPGTPDGLYAPALPQHPFEAANGRSGIHDDAFQSDTSPLQGPLGRSTQVVSAFFGGVCGSVTFDRHGRIVTVCVTPTGPTLRVLDPHTLAELASLTLPPRQGVSLGGSLFQSFGGGGYFFLDAQDRAVVPTTDRHVRVVAVGGSGQHATLTTAADYDLTGVTTAGDPITSVLPDWSGRLWAETGSGTLVTIDPRTGALHRLALGEDTENSFAIDETGAVFVISTKALYKLRAGADGTPEVVWRTPYANSGVKKPGQVNAGSGTTPTVQGRWVTFTDNADPMQVVVVRRSDGGVVCHVPVFGKGAGSDENSLIGIGHLIVVENNYGYDGPAATEGGATTVPGVARVDIAADGRGCHRVWANDTLSVPTVVSKLSLASGLIYTYTKDHATSDPWWLTAVDVRTGRLAFQLLAGTGLGFNNNYAPVTLGPDGTAYVGTLGGLVALSDRTPLPPATVAPPPLRIGITRPTPGTLRLALTGDTRDVSSVTYRVGGTLPRSDRGPGYARRLQAPRRAVVVRARVTLVTGAELTVRRRVAGHR